MHRIFFCHRTWLTDPAQERCFFARAFWIWALACKISWGINWGGYLQILLPIDLSAPTFMCTICSPPPSVINYCRFIFFRGRPSICKPTRPAQKPSHWRFTSTPRYGKMFDICSSLVQRCPGLFISLGLNRGRQKRLYCCPQLAPFHYHKADNISFKEIYRDFPNPACGPLSI